MDMKDRFEIIFKIVLRAERMGIQEDHGDMTRCTEMLDMDFADRQFNLRLDEFLAADDENFAHDFCGIQRHMNRDTHKMGDFFVPRFAGNH